MIRLTGLDCNSGRGRTMSKHTPGPWDYAASDFDDGKYSIYHNGPLAYCGDTTNEPGDGEANARLIASAPDLLAALEAVTHAFYVDGTAKALRPKMVEARAAIAKARGGAA